MVWWRLLPDLPPASLESVSSVVLRCGKQNLIVSLHNSFLSPPSHPREFLFTHRGGLLYLSSLSPLTCRWLPFCVIVWRRANHLLTPGFTAGWCLADEMQGVDVCTRHSWLADCSVRHRVQWWWTAVIELLTFPNVEFGDHVCGQSAYHEHPRCMLNNEQIDHLKLFLNIKFCCFYDSRSFQKMLTTALI